MTDYMKEAERLTDEQIKALLNEIEYGNMVTFDDYAYLIARKIEWHVRAALLAHIQRGAVPEGGDGKRVLREVFALCEDTEAKCSEEPGDFARGRRFEAKGIARAIGAWYQEEFCGRTHMGEPAAPAPDQFRDAAKMMAEKPRVETFDVDFLARLGAEVPAPAEVPMPEPIGFIDSNDEETWATLTQNAHELATLKLRSTVFHVSQMHTYGDAREAAGYARGLKEAGRLISLWLKDPDVQRMLEFARDASRKVASWPARLNGEAEAALRGEVKP